MTRSQRPRLTAVDWFWKLVRGVLSLTFGLAVAIALLLGGAVIAVRYVITQIANVPPRPTFANDTPQTAPQPAPAPTAAAAPQTASAPQPSPSPTPKPLEPGAYRARVTQPIGLVFRAGPGRNYDRIGGLEYNSRLIVLEASEDGRWLKVRIGDDGPEGWVVSGNTERLD